MICKLRLEVTWKKKLLRYSTQRLNKWFDFILDWNKYETCGNKIKSERNENNIFIINKIDSEKKHH